jgi:hypothetical protein
LAVCEKLISWPFIAVVLNSMDALIWSSAKLGRDVERDEDSFLSVMVSLGRARDKEK